MNCTSLTKKGVPCKNRAQRLFYGEDRCHLHRTKKDPVPKEPKAPKAKDPEPEVPQDECCVCMESTTDRLACKHYLCRGCVGQMTTSTCPLCRGPLEAKYITRDMKREIESRKHEASMERFRSMQISRLQDILDRINALDIPLETLL
jgi:hypothetical protein